MKMEDYINEIKLELTGSGVLELELTDEVLEKVVKKALRELQRYIDTTFIVTRKYEKCIDLSTFLLSSILTMRFPASFDSQKPTAITTIKTISVGNAAANFSGKFAKLQCLSSLKNEFIVFLRVILLFDSLFGPSGQRSLRI